MPPMLRQRRDGRRAIAIDLSLEFRLRDIGDADRLLCLMRRHAGVLGCGLSRNHRADALPKVSMAAAAIALDLSLELGLGNVGDANSGHLLPRGHPCRAGRIGAGKTIVGAGSSFRRSTAFAWFDLLEKLPGPPRETVAIPTVSGARCWRLVSDQTQIHAARRLASDRLRILCCRVGSSPFTGGASGRAGRSASTSPTNSACRTLISAGIEAAAQRHRVQVDAP